MATHAASLFSPTLSGDGVAAAPWKHQSSAALRPIRAAASHRPIRAKVEPEAPAGFTPSPIEELYVITWESPKEQVFEMPSGGAAIMRRGPNLLKLARKEQCLALGTKLRSKFKINYQFYRVFPNGEVHYLHPNDGVYPEKVNAGREECQPH